MEVSENQGHLTWTPKKGSLMLGPQHRITQTLEALMQLGCQKSFVAASSDFCSLWGPYMDDFIQGRRYRRRRRRSRTSAQRGGSPWISRRRLEAVKLPVL